jgi:energy-converting hydrogenase Eha subunit B
MKKLESKQMEVVQGGYVCSDENNAGTLIGFVGAGLLFGGPFGAVVGSAATGIYLIAQGCVKR